MFTTSAMIRIGSINLHLQTATPWKLIRVGRDAILLTTAGGDARIGELGPSPPSIDWFQSYASTMPSLYDAGMLLCCLTGNMAAFRGPLSGHQIYVRIDGDAIHVSTEAINLYDSKTISEIDGSADSTFKALAAMYCGGGLSNAFDISVHSTITPLCRHNHVSVFTFENRSFRATASLPVVMRPLVRAKKSQDLLESHLKDIISQSTAVVVELSGGLDSAVIAALATAASRKIPVHAVNVRYPYFEFRNEGRYVDDLLSSLKLPITFIDGNDLGEYDDLFEPIESSEPNAVAVSNATYYRTLLRLTQRLGASTILTGGGGDLAYANERFFGWPTPMPPDEKLWGAPFCRDIQGYCQAIEIPPNLSGAHPGYPWIDNQLGNIYFSRAGIRFESGFACKGLLEAIDEERHAFAIESSHRPKELQRRIFKKRLPASVIDRLGKVDHCGLDRRGFVRKSEEVAELIKDSTPVLMMLGLKPNHIARMLAGWRYGRLNNDRLLTALISLCAWRRSFRKHAITIDTANNCRSSCNEVFLNIM